MKSLIELQQIKERMKGEIGLRDASSDKTRVVVGMATCGIASGARPVLNTLAEEVRNKNLDNVMVTQTGCIGLCQYEPIVEVFEPGKPKVTYIWMDAKKAKEVVEQHLINGNVVDQYTLKAADKLK
jgi:NADP-reducing hydrogenase subunit HndB